MALSPSGSSKRARTTINNANQTVTCVVDECTVDLTNCRKYHQRHKVCEVHSKTPQVSINGKKLRFCQQCSRFHSLEEFDEGKRSCRKRLDGHNRRRRKAQPNIYYGVNVLQFVGPQVHQTMAPTNPPLAQVDSAPSLLSSSPSQTSGTTVSHVVHPSASSLDPGLSYGGLENGSGMIDMGSHHYRSCDHEDPQALPFYWQ